MPCPLGKNASKQQRFQSPREPNYLSPALIPKRLILSRMRKCSKFLRKQLKQIGLASLVVQKLHALWMKGCGGGAAPQALALPSTPVAVGVSPGSGLLLGSNKGLAVADRDLLRRALEAKFADGVVDLESLPSMPFLNIVKTQRGNKAWDWLPWKKVFSEKVAPALKGRKLALGPLEFYAGLMWRSSWTVRLDALQQQVHEILYSGAMTSLALLLGPRSRGGRPNRNERSSICAMQVGASMMLCIQELMTGTCSGLS